MSDREGRFEFDVGSTREYATVLLVAWCVLAVVLATVLVPIAATAETGGSPAETLLPDPRPAGGNGTSGAGSGGAGQLGMLDAGGQTDVGGSLAGPNGSSAFRSQNAVVHFVVESQEPAYWRTGAYDEYTGSGWEQTGVSDATAFVDGEEVRYRVALRRDAQALPTVWRPTALDGNGTTLTDGGLARTNGSVGEGATYVGRSVRPPRDPELLRASDRDYPAAIEQRYTDLPDGTQTALAPFTADIVEGSDSPYETATRIERWLERNKSYSLDVSEPPSEDVARQFVFGMEAGYCEYFATSMVAMARSQGLPARYVVGYSTGQRVDDTTYRVRGMNAHAWAEVYFADVGWVRFDPTPGQARLQQEQQSFRQQGATGAYEPRETGSPGETFTAANESANGTEATPGGAETDTEGTATRTPTPNPTPDDETSTPATGAERRDDGSAETNGRYAVSLNRSAVPGAPVEVAVTDGEVPVLGATVRVDGEAVGATNHRGVVVATVPYAENVTITAEGGRPYTGAPGESAPATPASDRTESWTAGPGGAVDGRFAAAGAFGSPADLPAPRSGPPASAPSARSDPSVSPSIQDGNATREVTVETNVSLTVTGDRAPGSDVVVTATVDGVPVRNATVYRDGARIGRTDDDGRVAVTLPAAPGNVTLRAVRDPVSGSRTLSLRGVNATVEPVWPLALPGTPVEVTATVGDRPAPGARVMVAGDRVGETGVNGTLTASLPLQSSVPVRVATAGRTVERTVASPLANLVGVVGGVAAVAVAGLIGWRRRAGERSPLAALGAILAAASSRTVGAFVGAVLSLDRLPAAVAARLRAVRTHLVGLATGRESLGDLLAAVRAWFRTRLGGPDSRSEAPSTAGATDEAGARAGTARVTIREGWDRFLAVVSIERPGRKTPGQLAVHAVETDGLPRDAVLTLRDEFRAVEYGPRPPDEAVPAVERAVERIEVAARDADASDEDPTTSGDEAPSDGGVTDEAASDEAVGDDPAASDDDGPVPAGGDD